jgi:LuxR family maltose regulon positive regulatory protein
LLQQLTGDEGTRFRVIVAPAGYGKSVLATEWIARLDHPVAWVTLREGGGLPHQFLAQLRLAITRAGVDLPQSPHGGPNSASDQMLQLMEAIETDGSRFTMVLDDLHEIQIDETVRLLELFLTRLPDNLDVVITSRSQLSPALNRQRASGNVIDVTMSDLTFTASESRAYFAAGPKLTMTDDQLAFLEQRSEGWISALALIRYALNDKSPSEVEAYLDHLRNEPGIMGEYLFEEVIRALPSHLKQFAVQVSILDNLDPDACNAVLQREGSRLLTRELERLNLFVITHDDRRTHSRFHHLFRDALRHTLREETDTASRRELHLRAARFFFQRGDLDEATAQAIEADDWDLAIEILETLCTTTFIEENNERTWYWLQRLPREKLLAAGKLAYWFAWSCVIVGKTEQSARTLDEIEPLWRANGDSRLLGEAALIRTSLAFWAADDAAHDAKSQEAMSLLAGSNGIREMQAARVRSDSLRYKGKRAAAAQALERAHQIARTLPIDQTWWATEVEYTQASWAAIEGRLREALTLCQHLLTLVNPQTYRVATTIQAWIAGIYLEWNELDNAEEIGNQLVEASFEYWNPGRMYTVLARISWALRRPEEAMDRVEKAISYARLDRQLVVVRSAEAYRAWMWAVRGELGLAQQWERANPIETISWLRVFNTFHGGLASIRIALEIGDYARASELSQALVKESSRRQRWGEMVRLHVLLAVARLRSGDHAGAMASLNWAVRLGSEGHFIRSFLDDGLPLIDVLSDAKVAAIAPAYVQQIRQEMERLLPPAEGDGSARIALSDREREVLGLVAEGLPNQAVAEKLFISEATVRKHLTNIYQRFGVTNRMHAVQRARQAGLI